MNPTSPLETVVVIALLLVVIGCIAVCVVAVRWLRRIALQVEDEQTRKRERDAAESERAAERAMAEADRARAERDAAEELAQVRQRVVLAEEELLRVRTEAAKAQADLFRAQTEAARAQLDAARAETERAAEIEQAETEADRRSARGDDAGDGSDLDVLRDAMRRLTRGDDGGDLARHGGDLSDILRRLGIGGDKDDDVSIPGIDPHLLRMLPGVLPPDLMRRLSGERGPADIEAIGDWIRKQVERSMRDRGGEHGGGRRRPAGFQPESDTDRPSGTNGAGAGLGDSSRDESDPIADDPVELDPDSLPRLDDDSEQSPDNPNANGLDVAALIEEALRDRDRRRTGASVEAEPEPAEPTEPAEPAEPGKRTEPAEPESESPETESDGNTSDETE